MSDIPELAAPNAEADKDPTQIHVPVTPIKSDTELVGGVLLGAMDHVDLDAKSFNESIDSGVAAALKFKPVKLKSASEISTNQSAQLTQDVLPNISVYMNTRTLLGKQLLKFMALQDKSIRTAAERRSAVNTMILERTVNARLHAITARQSDILAVNQNQLRFQTQVTSPFMRQTLALSYRQLFSTNNLITLTKAFAQMVENKLEAIKINSKLPDAKKLGILGRVKEALFKEVSLQAARYAVNKGKDLVSKHVIPSAIDYLKSDTRPDLKLSERLTAAGRRASDVIRTSEFGGRVLDAAQTQGQKFSKAAAPFIKHTQDRFTAFSEQNRLNDRLHPDVLWDKSRGYRQKAAQLLGVFSDKNKKIFDRAPEEVTPAEPIPEQSTLRTSEEKSYAPQKQGLFASRPQARHQDKCDLSKKVIQDLVTKRLDKIIEILLERLPKPVRANSYDAYKIREKGDLEKLKSQEEGVGKKRRGILGTLAAIANLGRSHKEKSAEETGGLVSDLEEVAEVTAAGAVGSRLLRAGKAGARGLFGIAKYGGRQIGKLAGLGGAAAAVKSIKNPWSSVERTEGESAAAGSVEQSGVKAAKQAEVEATKAGKVAKSVKDFQNPWTSAAKAAGEKAAEDSAKKVGVRAAVGTAAKVGGRFLLKKAPVIGLGLSGYDAYHRASKGDWFGAAGELAGGAAAMVPGVGTAASVAIQGLLIARDMNNRTEALTGNRGNLLKARMNVYGADNVNVDVIRDLEARIYPTIAQHKHNPIDAEELQGIAKKFGFDPTNGLSIDYFRQWLQQRFYRGFQLYLLILSQQKYNYETESEIPDRDVAAIIDIYNRYGSEIAKNYKDLKPSPQMFRATADKPPSLPGVPKPPTIGVPPQSMAPSHSQTEPSQPTGGIPHDQQISAPVVPHSMIPPAENVVRFPTRNSSVVMQNISAATTHYTPMPTASQSAGVASMGMISYNAQKSSGYPGPSNDNNTGPTTPITGGNFKEKSAGIMQNLMKDFGLTKEQAAGVVGNLGHESGGFKQMQERNPLGGGRGGLGWAQWTGPRRVAYETYCKSNGLDPCSDQANYGYLKQELSTSYKGTIAAVKKANTSAEAMQAFEQHYEAAGVKNYAGRQNYTDVALANFDKSSGQDNQQSSVQLASADVKSSVGGSAPQVNTAPSGTSSYRAGFRVNSPSNSNIARASYTPGNDTGFTPSPQPGTSSANVQAAGTTPQPETSAGAVSTSGLPKGVVGSGQCVDLVKNAAGLGPTASWQQGGPVCENPNLTPGMAIACFDSNGKYGNHTNGTSHAAIYLGPSTKYPGGIRVYDQWSGHQASERDIRPGGGTAINNASSYSVIKTASSPNGVVAPAVAGSTPPTSDTTSTQSSNASTPSSTSDTSSSATSQPGDSQPSAQTSTTPSTPSSGKAGPYIGGSQPSSVQNTTFAGNAQAGPTQNIINPVKDAMAAAQTAFVNQSLQTVNQTPSPPPQPPSTTHPDLVASSRQTADLMKALLDSSGGIQNSIQGLHDTTKAAFGDKGPLAAIGNMTPQQPSGPIVVAPTVNKNFIPDNSRPDDDGLDLSKKRRPRYDDYAA